jgi:hypothetical protein
LTEVNFDVVLDGLFEVRCFHRNRVNARLEIGHTEIPAVICCDFAHNRIFLSVRNGDGRSLDDGAGTVLNGSGKVAGDFLRESGPAKGERQHE